MTVNPLQGYRSQVYMLAVLRYADKTVIASYCESKEGKQLVDYFLQYDSYVFLFLFKHIWFRSSY